MKSAKWVDALNPDCDLFFSISQRQLEIRSSYDSHLNELLSAFFFFFLFLFHSPIRCLPGNTLNSVQRECISPDILPVLHHRGVSSAAGTDRPRYRPSLPAHQHHLEDDPAQRYIWIALLQDSDRLKDGGVLHFIVCIHLLPSTEKTNMHVTRLPSLRNINRVVDELGNSTNSERDPSQAPTISILTQSEP